ncbi:hypothetical protein Btru_057743 [Bulinus truncatus]|nr:hypothetical protein Btru_057743 [Bulinus truncatus]
MALSEVFIFLIGFSAFCYYTDGANSRPVCSRSYNSATLLEGTKKPASVIRVNCSDPDKNTLTYYFDINGGGNFDNTFKLNSSTGELTLNIDANAEQILSGTQTYSYPFTMRVLVSDKITTPLVITMFVGITDINDNTPTINGLPKTISVSEDSPVGTRLTACQLVDSDYPGGGNDIPYVKIKGGDPNSTFAIDYKTCDLRLVRLLDYEQIQMYTLVLMTYDIGPNATNSRSSSVTLTVSVLNVNDNPPTCSSYNVIRDVHETVSLGSVLFNLNCTDLESKNALNYTVISRMPSTDTRLQVNSASGAVILNGVLDYENNDRKLEIKVQVSDFGFPIVLNTVVTFVVRVIDDDDNPPVLDKLYLGCEQTGRQTERRADRKTDRKASRQSRQEDRQKDISEDANIGAYVLSINSTDTDSPNTDLSKVRYGFEDSCTQPGWFKIDNYTGSILVYSLLDWETAPNVTCLIYAYSSTNYASRRISSVMIILIDVNDREPYFTQYVYEGFVLENSPLGISVGNVSAVDLDSGINGKFNFSLPQTKHFLIDPISGVVTLNGPVDYENETSFLVLVEARDMGTPTFSSQSYINVQVGPVNEFSPVFSFHVGTQTVTEADEPGSFIVSFLATDNDHGPDGQVAYTLQEVDVPFILESDSGRLVIGLGLDAEQRTQYNLTVIASDQSPTSVRNTSMSLLVNIIDANDNPPSCAPVAPLTLVSPSTGQLIVQLNCSDDDVTPSTLSYFIINGDPRGIFMIGQYTGQLSLSTLSHDDAGVYYLFVRVSDDGSPQLSTTFDVEVNLELDMAFENFPTSPLHIMENLTVPDSILNISVSGAYDTIMFGITGKDINDQFSIHRYSGNLRTVKPLDRENVGNYTLLIQASARSGQVISKSLDVIVDDVNDWVPTFPNSFYTRRVLENALLPQSLGLFTALDKDSGINSLLTYSICSGNTASRFNVDPSTGEVKVIADLNSEAEPDYIIGLCVEDGGSPALSSSAMLFVIVENVDESPPVITPSGGLINLTLSEDSAIGSKILIINGSDPDRGSEVSYSITNPGGDPALFFIDDHSGEVFLIYPLDRETLPSVTIVVRVVNTIGQSATANVSVTVTDVNDEDPLFDLTSSAFAAPHGTAADSKVGTLIVTDRDDGVNGSLILAITSGDPNANFKINGFDLVSSSALDANVQSMYVLTVTASDEGNPPRSSSMNVTVNILPEFKRPSFQTDSASVTVPETLAAGSLIYDADATQLGAVEGSEGDLIYSIPSGDIDADFHIEPFEGRITLVSPLSYAAASFYPLLVLARNRYNLSLTGTATVNTIVQQVNRQSPLFFSDVYTFTVNETSAVGTSVGQTLASDSDDGQFGQVTYSIKSGVPFQINPSSGVITLTGILEYSREKSYGFYVIAVDNAGVDSKTSSAVVIVNVKDSNNHAPIFSSSPYSIALLESFPLNHDFLFTRASDLDSGSFGEVRYAIISGNVANVFSVNSTDGSLTLQKPLDYESVKSYTVVVRATDGGNPSRSSTATVAIAVKDVNDNAPKFSPGAVELNLPSTTPALSLIYTASATDKDEGDNGQFSYVIVGGNDAGIFTVDALTGDIKTAKPLISSNGFYSLTLAAVDQGQPSLTGTVLISVAVNPVVSLPVDMSVSENQPSGTFVGSVPHTSSLVKGYTIEGGNYRDSFTVINATGALVTAKPLDREDYGYYQLSLTSWGASGQIASVTLNVKVNDLNDNPPKFTDPKLTIYVVENLNAGVSVGQVMAVDPDALGVNSDVTYSLTSVPGSRYFLVDSTTGRITLRQPVDYEVVSSMTFPVVATDNGTPQMSSTAVVNVVVYNVPETVNQKGFNATYFTSHEFPHDAAEGDVVCSLTPEDFDLDPAVNRKNNTISVGDNVFDVSSSGVVTVNTQARVFENGRYFQWLVLTTEESSGLSESRIGLMRLDTFNKDKHLVAVVVSLDESDLRSNIELLRRDLQAKFPSPNKVKIWQVQSTQSITNRRRLLAAESAALVVVVADGAADSKDNVDMTKTFLTQSHILSTLQQSADGTPVSGLSSSVPVTKVAPYQDNSQDSGLDTAIIVLIVFAVLAAIIIITVLTIVVYCCLKRKKGAEDKLDLAQHGDEMTSTDLNELSHNKILYSSFPHSDHTDIEDEISGDELSSGLLTTHDHRPDTAIFLTRELARRRRSMLEEVGDFKLKHFRRHTSSVLSIDTQISVQYSPHCRIDFKQRCTSAFVANSHIRTESIPRDANDLCESDDVEERLNDSVQRLKRPETKPDFQNNRADIDFTRGFCFYTIINDEISWAEQQSVIDKLNGVSKFNIQKKTEQTCTHERNAMPSKQANEKYSTAENRSFECKNRVPFLTQRPSCTDEQGFPLSGKDDPIQFYENHASSTLANDRQNDAKNRRCEHKTNCRVHFYKENHGFSMFDIDDHKKRYGAHDRHFCHHHSNHSSKKTISTDGGYTSISSRAAMLAKLEVDQTDRNIQFLQYLDNDKGHLHRAMVQKATRGKHLKFTCYDNIRLFAATHQQRHVRDFGYLRDFKQFRSQWVDVSRASVYSSHSLDDARKSFHRKRASPSDPMYVKWTRRQLRRWSHTEFEDTPLGKPWRRYSAEFELPGHRGTHGTCRLERSWSDATLRRWWNPMRLISEERNTKWV